MTNKVWVVFAVRGNQIIEPTVFARDHETTANILYENLRNRMQLMVPYETFEPGWSVHKVLAMTAKDDALCTRIAAEARAELDRIERDGGEEGFAMRVLKIAEGDDG